MNEVEKMYSNSGIKKIELDYPDNFEPFYPEFTAEKQIELIKWLSQHTCKNYIKFRFDICGLWYCECNMLNSDMHHTFEEALAEIINYLWQNLTEEERKQIKEILE